jgi:hypothetical protein
VLRLVKCSELDPSTCRSQGEGDDCIGKGRKKDGLRDDPNDMTLLFLTSRDM